MASGALLLLGLVGAGVMSVLMEKTKAYTLLQKCSVVLASAGMILMLVSLQRGNEALLVSAFGFLGFCLIPLLPVNLESAAETTFPVPEDNSAAVLLSVGNSMGIIYIFVLPALLSLAPSSDCSSIWTWFALFVSHCNLFVNGATGHSHFNALPFSGGDKHGCGCGPYANVSGRLQA